MIVPLITDDMENDTEILKRERNLWIDLMNGSMSPIGMDNSVHQTVRVKDEIFDIHIRNCDTGKPWCDIISGACANIVSVAEELGLVLSHRGPIMVFTKRLKYSMGQFNDKTESIYLDADLSLNNLEPTLFHEMMHYFFYSYFCFEEFAGYLDEGMATFYTHKFYSDISELWFLKNRVNSDWPTHSIGYLLFLHNYEEIAEALRSHHSDAELKRSFPSIPEKEIELFFRHLSQYLLVILKLEGADDKISLGVLYTMDMECPHLITLGLGLVDEIQQYDDSPDVISISESDYRLLLPEITNRSMSVSPRTDWRGIIHYILAYSYRIKEFYRYY